MALTQLFGSRRFKQLTVVRLVLMAGRAFLNGRPRAALGYLGVASLATRSTVLAFLAEGVLWLLRRTGEGREVELPGEVPELSR